MRKVVVMVGTRPEAIKMAPVYLELKKYPQDFQPILVSTGQHKEMLQQALMDFGVSPDIDLHIMTQNQTLSGMSAKLFGSVDSLFSDLQPDIVLVQGDTTTVMVASLCAFYHKIPVGHVEAGLRSHNINLPFPEELNRRVTGIVANWHFAPTELSAENLIREGISSENICVSGNTVIDSLLFMQKKVNANPPQLPFELEQIIKENRRIILVTGHRRESVGHGFVNMCEAIKELTARFPEDRIVYPVHLNPQVRETVFSYLKNVPGVILTDPLPYRPFVYLMDKSYLILTDSGGIQEEGPSIGKPVLIMRDVTERPEGVKAGVNFLVGTDKTSIYDCASSFLIDSLKYREVQKIVSPFGDGFAASRIVKFLLQNTSR